MKRQILKSIVCAFFMGCFCAVPSISSYAATPEEAAAIAAQYGIPDELLQQCWNEYYANPELYTPETIDMMIEQLKENYKDIIVSTVPFDPNAGVIVTTTTTVSTEPAPTDTASDNTPQPVNESPDDNLITLTMPDGSEFTRIPTDTFISLSYEDKMTYLSTFTPEQQTVFIDNLSPEEYKSMLKQLPTEEKLEIVGGLSDITNTFGMNITVDEISSDNLSYSMKNKDGELVAAGSVKETVDNTGYDRRGILAVAGAFVIIGLGGLVIMLKKCFGKASENE